MFSAEKVHEVGGKVYRKGIERISDDEFIVCANSERDGNGTSAKINLVCFLVCSSTICQVSVQFFKDSSDRISV